MKLFGAIICELLGNSEWTNKILSKYKDYEGAIDTPGVDPESHKILSLMKDRANSLATRHWANRQNNKESEAFNKSNYQKATDELYPNRVRTRDENNAQFVKDSFKKKQEQQRSRIHDEEGAQFTKSSAEIKQKERQTKIDKAKSFIPKSLRKK